MPYRQLGLVITILALALITSPGTFLAASEPANAPEQPMIDKEVGPEVPIFYIRGKLFSMDGKVYRIEDTAGRERTLIISKDTNIVGRLKVGDIVEAELLENGHAIMIVAGPERKK